MDNRLVEWPTNVETGSTISKAPSIVRSGSMPPMNAEHRRLSGDVIELKEDVGNFREEVRAQLHMLHMEIDRLKSGSNVGLVKKDEFEAVKIKVDDIHGKLSGVALETLKANPQLASQQEDLSGDNPGSLDTQKGTNGLHSEQIANGIAPLKDEIRQQKQEQERLMSILNAVVSTLCNTVDGLEEASQQKPSSMVGFEKPSPNTVVAVSDGERAGTIEAEDLEKVQRLAGKLAGLSERINDVHQTGLQEERQSEDKQSAEPDVKEKSGVINSHSSRATVEEVEQHVQDMEIYEFNESCWEVTVVLGTSALHIVDHVVTFLMMMLNVFMQGLVCLILVWLFWEADDYRVDAARSWRRAVGHSDNMADSLGQSLVSRMCHYESLPVSGAQQDDFTTVDDYLQNFGGLPVGMVVCIWTLSLWCMTIFGEIRHTAQRIFALSTLLKMEHSHSHIYCVEDEFVLHSLGLGHFIAIVFFSILRITASVSVGIAGTLWLARTDAATDLILNAAALAFVMDLDEMLYEYFCPVAVKALLLSLKPIPMPDPLGNKVKIPKNALSTLAVLAAFFAYVYPVLVDPRIDMLQEIWDEYCAGNKHFILGTNPTTGIYYSYQYKGYSPAHATSVLPLISGSLIDGSFHNQISTKDYLEFKTKLLMKQTDATKALGMCGDWTEGSRDFFRPALTTALPGHSAISSCADITIDDCGGHPVVRLACPAKCGCLSVVSGIFFLQGCPLNKCSSLLKPQKEELRRFNTEPQMLASMPEWRKYWSLFLTLNGSLSQYGIQQNATAISSKFMEFGCDAFKYFEINGESLKNAFCATNQESIQAYDTMFFRPLRPFCPQSCTCNNRRRNWAGIYCPQLMDDYVDAGPERVPHCASMQVSGGSLLTSSACKQTLSRKSSPEGTYKCKPYGYNGNHLYHFDDSEGTLWVIRWETDANLDWGARFLGAGVGLQGQSKWTLVSMVSSHIDVNFEDDWVDKELDLQMMINSDGLQDYQQPIVARFFADGRAAETSSPGSRFPPQNNWFPRNTTNSDADCAAGSISTEGSTDYRMLPWEQYDCPSGYTIISSEETCENSARALGSKLAKDQDSDAPEGCSFHGRRRSDKKGVHFNKKDKKPSAEFALICVHSSLD